ncbi:hypothetical protein D6D17_06037 [Aureobasidium pullulans]|nr:hypothetical protein D6D17_06037 [Aureobasidium pullulans]
MTPNQMALDEENRNEKAVNDVQKRYKHSYDGLPMSIKTVKSISTGVFVSQKITVHLASMIPHCEKVKESRALLYSLGINATVSATRP